MSKVMVATLTSQEIPFGAVVSELFSSILQAINSAIQLTEQYTSERLIYSVLDSIEEAGKELAPSVKVVNGLLADVEKAIPLTKEGSPKFADDSFEEELEKRLELMEHVFALMRSVRDKSQISALSQKTKDRTVEVMDGTAKRLFELYHAMEDLNNAVGNQHALTTKPIEVGSSLKMIE